MKQRIAVGGSAANPPHLGHFDLIKGLIESRRFDKIFWIPSGSRPDKTGIIGPDDRVAMTLLTIPSSWMWAIEPLFVIRFTDVYGKNTSTIEVLRNFKKEFPDAEIFWYTGVDSVVPRKEYNGKCDIEEWWDDGDELMRNWKFCIIPLAGYPHPSELDLPSQFEILDIEQREISSTVIRQRIENGDWIDDLVTPEVSVYIKRHGLYTDSHSLKIQEEETDETR